MNLQSFTAAALLGLGTAFAPTVAKALPAGLEDVIDAPHYELLQSVEETGATVVINDGDCFEGGRKSGFYGYWSGHQQKFVICTEASTRPGQLTQFSAEDLDTIRHEAIHLAQDWVGDKTPNGQLETISVMNDGFVSWVNDNVPSHRMDVVLSYEKAERSAHLPLNSDKHIMNLEAEAEAYAASESADQINDVVRYWAFGEEKGEQVRNTSSTSSSRPAPAVIPGVVNTVLNVGLGLL